MKPAYLKGTGSYQWFYEGNDDVCNQRRVATTKQEGTIKLLPQSFASSL